MKTFHPRIKFIFEKVENLANTKLTKPEARKIILYAAGLAKHAQFGKGKEAVFKAIDHLGFVQVDTIYVVERAHHHALASRVPNYKTEWLLELQDEGRIYEFWTRDSGFMPVHDFRYSLPIHDTFLEKYKSLSRPDINLMNKVLDRIGREGPLQAKDFENDRVKKSSGWWDWRPSKVALERLHFSGKLLTSRKKDFHKMYDLTDNIIPSDIDRTKPSIEEFTRHLILRSLKSMGIAYAKEIAWNGRLVKHNVKAELKKMVEEGAVLEVEVEGLKGPLYMHPTYQSKKTSLSGDVFILSPFDSLNVFRHRLRDFFDFDYQIECFVPQPKRKYGYFSLPILAGDTFIARMDSKAERKERNLIIHNLHFEPGKLSKVIEEKLIEAIRSFAKFNECWSVSVAKSNNKAFAKKLREIEI